ncbi:PBP1A family penicillin-binding protein [Candidatus Daviesbacteria bacterium]|nr:PBP1A family penicillin-binding protein [Candidatus Daviesbacteria bacterium]
MPKENTTKLSLTRPKKYVVSSLGKKIPLPFLVLQVILIMIGKMPLFIVNSLWNIFVNVRKLLLNLPTLNLHKRGRPRKNPALVFYKHRLAYFIKKKVPKRVKVGFALFILLAILVSYTSFILTAAYQLPSPNRLTAQERPLTTEIFDRNGNLLYRLYEGRNRTLVKFDEIPDHLKKATIAIEDKNFYHHFGVDPAAIIRAFYHNQKKGTQEGASTLTQQLIKNSLLSPEKTYVRKVKEVILAVWAELIYPKEDILAMYFNEAPYGGPNWGVDAAARAYFGKSVKDLSLAESTLLAGLPASPSEFSPYGTKPHLGKARQEQVLDRMVEEKYITKNTAEKAKKEKLKIIPPVTNIEAPHFVMYVKNLLAQKYGDRVVSQGGLKIHTTLDLGLQKEVERIVADEVSKLSGLNVTNGAALITDSKTGQILAMVGSKNYFQSDFGNFNATLSLRQPGSSIKPVTYVTSFKKGFSPGNTVLDTPVVFRDEWGNSYAPVNYDGTFHGPVSIRTALGSSYNVPAVKILATVGVDEVVQTAKDLGITTFTDPKRYGLSLTLGGAEVKMIDMMSVYGSFATNGIYNPSSSIIKVVDSEGNILEEYKENGQRVLQPELAFLITSILSDNAARIPAFGPNSLLNLPGVAVKTGTTDNKRDNWTFGYTPNFVVGVWVGNNNNMPMDPTLTSGITGAAPIWSKIMKGLLTANPDTHFIRPGGIVEVTVDGRKDIAVAGILPKELVRIRAEKDTTKYFDAFSSYATSSATVASSENTNN